ncbi:MAG: dehydrogenase [Alphaproteobacteria bacterium]|nr:dehydrogenase [Alphaproteobacteria bacterium]
MIIRSKAPLRIGLAGGGTDVSPYSDLYGGCILNATISLAAYATIEPTSEPFIEFSTLDRGEYDKVPFASQLEINGNLNLLKAVYNRVQKDYGLIKHGFKLSTAVDAPAGSGLGTSSTLVVAILGCFVEWLNLPLGEYDIAQLAYSIEREDLKLSGGKQDQYAATFGGVNFMEFYQKNVIVNPLRIKTEYLHELEHDLLLFYTETSRESAKIIDEQVKNVSLQNKTSLEATHLIKEQAIKMKECLLKGDLNKIGDILDIGFQEKRKIAHNISNSLLDDIYITAKNAGASGGKISGAGGGGFMIFYCPNTTKFKVMQSLERFKGQFKHYQFTAQGLTTWKTKS